MGIHRVNWYVQSEDDRLVQLSKSRGSYGLSQGYSSDLFSFWLENAIVSTLCFTLHDLLRKKSCKV